MTNLNKNQILAKFHKAIKPFLDVYHKEIAREPGCTERSKLLCLKYIKETEQYYQVYLKDLAVLGLSPFDSER